MEGGAWLTGVSFGSLPGYLLVPGIVSDDQELSTPTL